MATTPHQSEHREPVVFRDFDSSAKRILGVDMRLVYGLLPPALLVVGLIVLLALKPVTWLFVAIVVVEVGALALVVTGLLGMMSGGDDAQKD
jgi:hypothetical protein